MNRNGFFLLGFQANLKYRIINLDVLSGSKTNPF